jgi:hypothetical protein
MKQTREEFINKIRKFDEDFATLIETHQDKDFPLQIIMILIEKCVGLAFDCSPEAKIYITDWVEEFIKRAEEKLEEKESK